ncbi:MAG TPA: o-succinylbenzoate--CoA ligase [Gemmatimonadaceae bacterium]|nr:o-succinylbenzoate--CoA ligase [Gemmatimonadaceae bacterium]
MLLWLPWRAASTADRLALVAPNGSRLTYAELHARADVVARRLAALGVRAGDRVGVLLSNGAPFAEVVHACMRLGAVLLPLNLRLTPGELAWQVRDAGARVVLYDVSTESKIAELRAIAPDVATARSDDASTAVSDRADSGLAGAGSAETTRTENGSAASTALRERADPHEPLAIVYTSGTTGAPKGAVLSYSNFWWSAVGSALNLGVHSDDRWLAPLPLFHVGGLSVLTRSAIYGTTAVLHDGFDAERVSAAIDDDGITLVSLVPTMLHRLLDARGDRPIPSSLRCVLLGGGPAPRALLERCARLGVPVSQTYGLTECCSQVATLAPSDALKKLGSAGRALYPNELRLATADGADPSPGGGGEILVRGPVVTSGYWNRPDATASAFVDGWFRTGDFGMLDEDGYLYVLDRREDLIVTGGENVYPAEVEGVLLAHPSVAEAAVIGVADAEWGQRVVAVVRLADGADRAVVEEFQSHCRASLAAYKVPREVRISGEALPRTASGKLRRGALRESTPESIGSIKPRAR